MLKSLLVPIDASAYSAAAADCAEQIARAYDGELRYLYIVDSKLVDGSNSEYLFHALSTEYHDETVRFLAAIGPDGREQAMRRSLRSRGEQLLKAHSEASRQSGVRARFELAEGIVPEVICRHALAADLVVMGKRGRDADWGFVTLGSVVEAVVRSTHRPILVTPHNSRVLRRVLAAYDGSDHAGEALRLAADCCTALTGDLTVLVVEDDPAKADAILERANDYLHAYDLPITQRREKGPPAPTIVRVANEGPVDLLAMGAYGHSRARDLVIGSTTAHVLRAVERPTLLYR